MWVSGLVGRQVGGYAGGWVGMWVSGWVGRQVGRQGKYVDGWVVIGRSIVGRARGRAGRQEGMYV